MIEIRLPSSGKVEWPKIKLIKSLEIIMTEYAGRTGIPNDSSTCVLFFKKRNSRSIILLKVILSLTRTIKLVNDRNLIGVEKGTTITTEGYSVSSKRGKRWRLRLPKEEYFKMALKK